MEKRNYQPEKEKYARYLEQELQALHKNAALSDNSQSGRKIPLGKYVSQMEMTNPEARRQLREMLEF
jgi:hypothetical protein